MDTLPAPSARPPLLRPPISRVVTGRVGRPFTPLTLACLRLAAPHNSMPEWRAHIDAVCRAFGDGAVRERLQRLHREGYLGDGLPLTGYLTIKGRRSLDTHMGRSQARRDAEDTRGDGRVSVPAVEPGRPAPA